MTLLLSRSLDMSKAEIRSLYDTLGEVRENFPSYSDLSFQSLGLPARIVRIWFQNARSGRKAGKPMYC